MSPLALTALTAALMLLGLLGLVVPVLPDLPLMWVGALIYGLFGEWGQWGPYLFALITLLAVAGTVAEFWSSGVGAKAGGASAWGILAGLAGGLIGLLVLGPLGGIGGLLLGTFAVEWLRQGDPNLAARGMLGMGVGYGAGLLLKGLLGLMILAAWIVWLVVP